MSKRLAVARLACLVVMVAGCGSPASTPAATGKPTGPLPSGSVTATATPGQTPATSPAPGTPSASPTESGDDVLTELTTARAAFQAPGTVELDLTMSGTFDAGDPDYPWIVDLTGSQITAQFDLQEGSGAVNVSIPDMDGFTEEILLINDLEFARSSLGGNIWTRQQANGSIGSLVSLLRDTTGSALMDAMVDGVLNAASAPDATFHGTAARQVTLTVTVPETFDIEAFIVSTLGSKVGTPPDEGDPAAATKTMPVALFLASDDMRPLGIELSMPSGASDPDVVGDGSVSIDGVFSRPSETLTVTAPKKFVDATNPFNPPR